MNAMILISCLVFVDMTECIERLEKLTYGSRPPTEVTEKSKLIRKNLDLSLFQLLDDFVFSTFI